MDINISSQIVVQTSAQWAADNTVYSAKRILVTSDANWDNTDQRKFKIADGTQTWSQLDYPPIGYETMTTSAGEFKFAKTTAGAVLLWTNGQDMRFSASVGGSPAFILKTDGTIVLENGTANKFLKTGASKEITLVDNPVDVNTIGSAINVATSATPNDNDLVMSVDTSVAKKNTWTQIKAFLKTYFDTVYQAAGTYLTSANITQTITNGVTDKAPSEDAVYDALALKSSVIAKQTTDSSHSGNTTNTIITNILIPANSMGANDIAFIEASLYKTGTTDIATWTIYLGPNSNSLVGANSLGNSISTSNQAWQSIHRTIANKNSQSTNYSYATSGGVENPWGSVTAARSAINQDFANNLYLMVAVQMGGTTDTGGVDWIYMTKQ